MQSKDRGLSPICQELGVHFLAFGFWLLASCFVGRSRCASRQCQPLFARMALTACDALAAIHVYRTLHNHCLHDFRY
jgi:hypothetical protein